MTALFQYGRRRETGRQERLPTRNTVVTFHGFRPGVTLGHRQIVAETDFPE